jgi:hypothetical protein
VQTSSYTTSAPVPQIQSLGPTSQNVATKHVADLLRSNPYDILLGVEGEGRRLHGYGELGRIGDLLVQLE